MRARQARGSRRGHMTRQEQVARAVADDISRFSLASTLSESAHDSMRAQHTPPTDKKMATQHAAMISQACGIFGIPLSTTLTKFSKENLLIGCNGDEVHVVNAALPALPILLFNPQPIPEPIHHNLCITAEQLI